MSQLFDVMGQLLRSLSPSPTPNSGLEERVEEQSKGWCLNRTVKIDSVFLENQADISVKVESNLDID